MIFWRRWYNAGCRAAKISMNFDPGETRQTWDRIAEERPTPGLCRGVTLKAKGPSGKIADTAAGASCL